MRGRARCSCRYARGHAGEYDCGTAEDLPCPKGWQIKADERFVPACPAGKHPTVLFLDNAYSGPCICWAVKKMLKTILDSSKTLDDFLSLLERKGCRVERK